MKALVRHEVKPASLGQAMIKAVKPSSYIPPLLFGLGVELDNLFASNTAQKIKFSMKAFFSKCDQILSFLRIWSHLLKKSLMENFIFCVM